jgi:large subunit ribosomal protein L6
MSRIGKKPIAIPEKTSVSFDGYEIKVKGPLGELSRVVKPEIGIEIKDGAVQVTAKRADSKPLWGTYAAHIKNMIAGVQTAYTKKLIIEGIGFKADVKGTDLVLNLGFSHPITVAIPKLLKVVSEKGTLTISGIDKEMVGGFAADIRSLKKPEPYKGKGIRYDNEVIRRKQGKKAA